MTSKSSADSQVIPVYTYWGAGPTQFADYSKKWSNSSVGGDNTGWKDLVASHKQATNSMSASRSFVDFQPYAHFGYEESVLGPGRDVNWHLKTGTTGFPNQYCSLESVPLTVVHSATAIGKAVGSFNAKLDSFRTGFSGLTFLGELRESLSMIKNRTKLLRTDVTDTKRKLSRIFHSSRARGVSGRTLTKNATDVYLEAVFGWLPLMNDIRAAVGNLSPEPGYRVIAGTGEVISGGTPAFHAVGYADGSLCLLCDIYRSDKTVSQVKCVAELSSKLAGMREENGLFFRDGSEQWGLSLRDFVPSAWELLPYSFLVDYFTNVGDVVAAPWCDRKAITWQYQTCRTTRVVGWSFRNLRSRSKGGIWMTNITANPGAIRLGTKRFDRQPTVTLIPPFYLQYPEMGNLRWANLLALWIQKTLTK